MKTMTEDKPKKRIGRPPKDPSDKAVKTTLYLPPDVEGILRALAADRGLANWSTYATQVLTAHARSEAARRAK